jgi:hypothetical protein
MKRFHKLNITLYVLFLALLAVSCVPEQESMGDAGQTLVKLSPSGYNMLAFDAKTTPQSGVLFEIRRDVPNSTDLNTASAVVLQYDADTLILKAYNTENETSYVPLPTSLGTVSPAITGGKLTVNFAAGETGKAIMINVPSAGSFDFSLNYALAFKIVSVSGTGKLSEAVGKTIVCEILAKNKWDGVYTVTGSFVDYVSSAWVGYYPKTVELRTIGANACSKYDTELAGYGYLFDTDGAGTLSQFGAWTPAFTFDASNNVGVYNTTTDANTARNRTAVLYTGDGAINKYNADKSMDVTYQLSQLNVSPVLRNLVTEHYVYKGPR